MGKAVRASSIWRQMPFMYGPEGADRLRRLLPILSRAKAEAEYSREVVLRSPDAAKQLCVLLGLTSAKHWNGYVPAPPPGPGRDKDISDAGESRAQLERLVRHAENDIVMRAAGAGPC